MAYDSCIRCLCRRSNENEKISFLVYLLVCMFGVGSWLAINGIWMELPILIDHAPEKWSLPSYLTVITELANIGPFIYFLGNKFRPKIFHERTAVYTITVLGTTACILLAFFWDRTSYIFGAERSTALIVLSFFVALVDCTSTVTFLPFMAILPKIYMSALFTGENLSSLLPSIFALIQGVNQREFVPRTICDGVNNSSCKNVTITVFTGLNFGPNYFFVFLASMMIVCGIAFIALNFSSLVQEHHVIKYSELQKQTENKPKHLSNDCKDCKEEDTQSLLDSNSLLAREHENFSSQMSLSSFPGSSSSEVTVASSFPISKFMMLYLLLLQAWINCINNGAVSQIQAFACEPYGEMAYHLAITLAGIGSAITCIVYLWIPTQSVKIISFCCFIYTVASGYIILLAAQSPHPLLKGTSSGSALVVLAFISSGIFFNYAKLAICTLFREKGHSELFWCGVAIQAGSFVGAIVMFPLINVAKLFKQ